MNRTRRSGAISLSSRDRTRTYNLPVNRRSVAAGSIQGCQGVSPLGRLLRGTAGAGGRRVGRRKRRWRSTQHCSPRGPTCTQPGSTTHAPGKGGWVPAVRGGWRKRHTARGSSTTSRSLPLVLAAHLKGEVHVGLYPLLDGDRCWWLAADFDGPEAMFDALMYVKAARGLQVPVALEVSRSGVGAHTWVFFTSPVPADGPPPGHGAVAGGHGDPRADDAGQLRPAIPVPGPAPLPAAWET